MITKKQKVIIVFIILIVLLLAIFFAVSSDKGKLFILKTVNRKNTEKTLLDRKKCEDNFVFDEAKFEWATKNSSQPLLKKYAFCEAGTKADYEYCKIGILSKDSGDAESCQKIVMFKKVFLPLAQKTSFPQDVSSDFEYFQSTSPPESPLKKLVEGEKNTSGELLNYFYGKDGKACDVLERKEPCLAFFTGDAEYCQDMLLDKDKNNCINEVVMRQALESQSIEKCLDINDKDDDGLMHVLCESIINKDAQFCAKNREYLGDFIGEYCKIENPLPI